MNTNYNNKNFILFLLIILLVSNTSCLNIFKPDPVEEVQLHLTVADMELTEADNKFGIKLFKAISEDEENNNLFISPLSISMALGMTYNGAAGETAVGMRNTLEYGELTNTEINESYKKYIDLLPKLDGKVNFKIANSIWIREGFSVRDEFIDLNKEYFDSKVDNLDFSQSNAVEVMNNWVSNATNDKIDKIIEPPISSAVIMYLINAIYFKADWTDKFKKSNTEEQPFYKSDGSTVLCQMMYNQENYGYYSCNDFQAVDLCYGDEKFSMTVILPDENSNIEDLLDNLSNENWNSWLNFLGTQKLNLYFPKFKLEYEKKLNDILKNLGMSKAFEPTESDFSNINEQHGEDLYISEVKHKIFIEVDEKGTEAAAATSVGISLTSAPSDPITLRIDRPFLFAIREHESGTILFIGKIENPVEE